MTAPLLKVNHLRCEFKVVILLAPVAARLTDVKVLAEDALDKKNIFIFQKKYITRINQQSSEYKYNTWYIQIVIKKQSQEILLRLLKLVARSEGNKISCNNKKCKLELQIVCLGPMCKCMCYVCMRTCYGICFSVCLMVVGIFNFACCIIM